MKRTLAAATLLVNATLASLTPGAQAATGSRGLLCTARVVHSEELPFAPMGSWLVKATLVITAPDGRAFAATIRDWMPWQDPPPRRGQAFRLRCDRANPDGLRLIHQAAARTAF